MIKNITINKLPLVQKEPLVKPSQERSVIRLIYCPNCNVFPLYPTVWIMNPICGYCKGSVMITEKIMTEVPRDSYITSIIRN